MATTLVVRFLLGRYHATPWGRHVNEGQVELPPSPWRLLRALYATWQTRVPDIPEETVHALLDQLAPPPTFFVPPFHLGHTRHYYPDSKSRSGTPSVDRTLDAFAVIAQGAELGIRWTADLPQEEWKALDRLASALPYLGRADSVCEARVDETWEPTDDHARVGPLDVGESIPARVEVVTLLAPTLPLDVGALVQRPVDVRAGRLLFPPATRFVGYPRPPAQATGTAQRRRGSRRPVEAVRFTVTSRVLPSETDAVVLTDRLRIAAVSWVNKLRNDVPMHSLIAGRHEDRSMMSGHRHAHFLALPGHDRRIEELVVWTPAGLKDNEMAAVANIRRLKPLGEGMPGPGPAEVRMAAYGDAPTVLPDLTGPSSVWQSVTPFVPPRHAKKVDWATFVGAELRRELQFRGFPAPVEVNLLDDSDWRAYLRYRPSKRFAASKASSISSAPPGCSVRLVFDSDVRGPLALGHLSHFGLGLLRPITNP